MALSHSLKRPRRRVRPFRVALWLAFGAFVIVVTACVWVGLRGLLAKGELESIIPLASTIQQQVVSGESASVGATAEELNRHAANAASLTSDQVWRAFETVPFLGSNLVAMRQLAAAVDDLAQNTVTPLARVAGVVKLSDFKPVNGAINPRPLVDSQPQFEEATDSLATATELVAAIDTSATLPMVRDATEKLGAAVSKASDSIGDVNRAVRLVPSMLGAAKPRNYLLLFQNPAELRATGGIAGAIAMIHTEDGKITLAQQASSADFPHYPNPVLVLPAETRGLYGDITGQYIQDVNLTPDFAQSGALAREMWNREFGVEADGVVSIDPVALSYLLRATGPIILPTGDVMTADNAVQLLLSDVYARYPKPADQDAFFAAAAASVFSAVSSGNADPVALIAALSQAGSEHRVLVWSAHAEDQTVLADTTLAGGLPLSDTSETRFGVYLNDGTGAKMGMYLDMEVALGRATCRKDERPSYGVTVTLTNTASADAATTLSDYVTGGEIYGVPRGNVKTVVSVYGAPGMQNLGMTRDDADVEYHPATDAGYPVSATTVELAPGQTTVLQFNWLGEKPDISELVSQMTPGIHVRATPDGKVTCESPLR